MSAGMSFMPAVSSASSLSTRGLFGWTKDRAIDMGAMGTYQTFATGGAPCGGMMTRCAQVPHACWNYYIAVDSVTKAAGRTKTGGGEVLQGPHEVPGGAWIVQARDSQGAAFAMISAKGSAALVWQRASTLA
jgi:predicted enzyme related to lactoylglutathione lyase